MPDTRGPAARRFQLPGRRLSNLGQLATGVEAAHSQRAPRHAGDAPYLTVTSGEPRSLTDAPQTPSFVTGQISPATSRAFARKRARLYQPVQLPQIRPKVAASAEREAGHSAVRSGL